MIVIIWTVATLTGNGLLLQDVVDETRFPHREACAAFGQVMTPRMADWMRGAVQAPWAHEVVVKFRCEADGRPA